MRKLNILTTLLMVSITALSQMGCSPTANQIEITHRQAKIESALPTVVDSQRSASEQTVSPDSKRTRLATPKPQPSTNESQLVLKRKELIDKGFGGIVSHHVYIPEGWKFEGEAFWANPSFYQLAPSPTFKATSPEGIEVELHAVVMFSDPRPDAQMQAYGMERPPQLSSDMGFPVLYMPESDRDIKDFFKDFVLPNSYEQAKNIRVTKLEHLPELAKMVRSQLAPLEASTKQLQAMATTNGLPFRTGLDIDAFEIHATFSENGVEKEYGCVFGFVNNYTQQQGLTQHKWMMVPSISFCAPMGQLDDNVERLATIAGTLRPTPQWNQRLQQHMAQMAKSNSPRPSASGKSVGDTYSEILDIQHEGFRRRQGMSDAGFANVIHSVNETQTYSFNDQQYVLPAGYDHAYTNDFDTIILTNDSLLQPNVDVQGTHEWSSMTPR
ncbi:MAG: hypothetical protein R3C03_10955 [Pirellulaceae bacterium]